MLCYNSVSLCLWRIRSFQALLLMWAARPCSICRRFVYFGLHLLFCSFLPQHLVLQGCGQTPGLEGGDVKGAVPPYPAHRKEPAQGCVPSSLWLQTSAAVLGHLRGCFAVWSPIPMPPLVAADRRIAMRMHLLALLVFTWIFHLTLLPWFTCCILTSLFAPLLTKGRAFSTDSCFKLRPNCFCSVWKQARIAFSNQYVFEKWDAGCITHSDLLYCSYGFSGLIILGVTGCSSPQAGGVLGLEAQRLLSPLWSSCKPCATVVHWDPCNTPGLLLEMCTGNSQISCLL